MKKFLVISILFVSLIGYSQDTLSNLTWHTNLEEAERISKTTHKPILMYFTGSDWCAPCVALKKDFFESEEFAPRADAFVLLMIDYPRRMDIISEEQLAYNKTIITKYNTDKSFPKLLVLNEKGKELGKLSGYSSYNTYRDISHHVTFVNKFASGSN